ncbi:MULTISPECIES: hypothetical protein [unclassified Tenacibaculum]|uniref:hypothetical protein n=1 Tax=unclassified Tenacibaculum TaxID=2635139 RepID=UPI001F1A3B2C|nr:MULTISPECIES: hypothetical protein [unclassified Tenacibaculum]MCF2876108.1 hypothetical protein [Tenacibaculum sp. Cn5-1]MCF2936183.1 hypothetical protein [Tenacibaculum sp. Cn5-34]MCG7512744.1 hypothetical protein [Tenacibaculum sp. Cn5-46]
MRKIIPIVCVVACFLQACVITTKSKESKAEKIETSNKIGGCVFKEVQNTKKVNPLNSTIEIESAKGVFSKKMNVLGLDFIVMEKVSDDFLKDIGQTMKEMFPQDSALNLSRQHKVLNNLLQYNATIPVIVGHHDSMSEEVMIEMENTYEKECSICDVIMYEQPGQTMEVVEHLLHFITDIGLHYEYSKEWAFNNKESEVYLIMQEAIKKGFYDVSSYKDMEGEKEVYQRVIVQEFAYWLISTYWNLQEKYGPNEEEWIIRNKEELKEKFPRGYQLVENTVSKIMKAPSEAILEKLAIYGE